MMKKLNAISLQAFLLGICLLTISAPAFSQEKSVARVWLETELRMIVADGQGPTIHSRNLFHSTAAMYDAWAMYDKSATTYLVGNTVHGYSSPLATGFAIPKALQTDSAREVAISYAAYRVLHHRFNIYGSKSRTLETLDSTFTAMGYRKGFTDADYRNGDPAALGNYIAQCYIGYGLQDGSKEHDNHEAFTYNPVNTPLAPQLPGSQKLEDKNRWQPLNLIDYINQRGRDITLDDWSVLLSSDQDDFLSPEWGDVNPFSLQPDDKITYNDYGSEFQVYLDPGPPPLLDFAKDSVSSEAYKWGFLLVGIWSAHMDPSDSVMMDISPGAIGDLGKLPLTHGDYPEYYNLTEGGTKTKGYKVNPYTNKPYAPNIVPRGDYARVIAEYWVDGINTASPPGHWFIQLNDAGDHPLFEKRWEGKGPVLSDLEWDIKSYFVMGGAMHDAAIAAWGAKGHYDYVRPITAIRYMAGKGQCSDKSLPSYHLEGLPLMPGHIELVGKKDTLAGANKEHVGKLKIYCWRGPEYVKNPYKDMAGVGWILAENWWPYQRYSFATPPFAGYVSGHSTFSLAGAEILTQISGSPFYPGGMAEFTAKKNEFLLFEEGPSRDITLQWATYRDAANETCLSRIWGGIHPPCDDIKGRLMGEQIGRKAAEFANGYFQRYPKK